MKCPYCGEDDTKVIDSRPADDNSSIRRRRQCERCGKRFTTYEKLETMPFMVIKKDRTREPYNRSKVEAGIVRSCHKRPVSTQQINAMLDAVTGLTAESEITDGEDLAQYGLENPSGIITLTTADGTTTLQLGDKNAVTGQYYLKVAESDKIYLVSRDLSGTFSKTPQELLKEEETEEPESVDATEGVEAAVGVDVTESAASEDSTEE